MQRLNIRWLGTSWLGTSWLGTSWLGTSWFWRLVLRGALLSPVACGGADAASPPAPSRAAAAPAAAPAPSPAGEVRACVTAPEANLDWLLGCWRQPGAMTTGERWQREEDGSLRAYNDAVKAGQVVHQEHITIARDAAGYHYTASPQGQPSATFSAAAVGSDCADFRNPDHDFPQHVGYRLDGDTLTAFIAGVEHGQAKRRQWRWPRVDCPDAPMPSP